MDAIKIIKTAIAIPAGIGTGAIIDNIVKVTTPQDTGRIMLVLIKVGSYALGAAVAGFAVNAVNEQIDDVVAVVNAAKKSATTEE